MKVKEWEQTDSKDYNIIVSVLLADAKEVNRAAERKDYEQSVQYLRQVRSWSNCLEVDKHKVSIETEKNGCGLTIIKSITVNGNVLYQKKKE